MALPSRLLCALLALAGLGLGCARHGGPALSQAERAWIVAHPVVRFSPDPAYPPVEWFDADGTLRGLVPDTLASLSRDLGLRFEARRTGAWEESLADLTAGRTDLVTVITDMPARHDRMAFTRPYLDIPSVLLSRTGDRIQGLGDLEGRRLAIVRSAVLRDLLTRAHPRIHLLEYGTLAESLRSLSQGGADAALADLANASWVIDQNHIQGIRVDCRLDELPSGFAMAVRREDEVLRGILDKGLANLDPGEVRELRRRWISLQTYGWRPGPLFWSALAAALLAGALALLLGWNRSLRLRVTERTRALEQSSQAHADLHRELLQAMAELRVLRGFIPICLGCKRIRDEAGHWTELETFLAAHSEAHFSHAYCPACTEAIAEEQRLAGG